MARVLFLFVLGFCASISWVDGKRRLYRKSRSYDTTDCEENGGFLLNDICYILGGDRGTWDEARDACAAYDGDLAVVVKKIVYDYILDMMDWELPDGSSAWIGLSDKSTEGLYEWVDGYVAYDEMSDYWDIFWEWSENLYDVEPTENCVHIDRNTGEASESDCQEQRFYVCEIITYPDEWELEEMNKEIEWENNLVELLSNASVMKGLEDGNKESLDELYEFDIKLNPEEDQIFKTGGDPASATGAFNFEDREPSVEELHALKEMVDEYGIESWDPASREYRRRRKRSALGGGLKAWPNAVIPYTFTRNFPYGNRSYTKQAMKKIEENSCVRFKERTNEAKYMVIDSRDPGLCYSQGIGYPTYWYEDTRNMNFGWCANHVPSIIHEFFHAMGFWHEMSRPDRDDYIEIIWKNLQPGAHTKFQFQKAEKSTFSGYAYDYFSIMHYHLNAMAVDQDKYTIRPKKLNVKEFHKVGNRKLPSKLDWYELNTVYKCDPKYLKKLTSAKENAVPTDDGKWGPCSVTCNIGTQTKEKKYCVRSQCYIQYETTRCFMPACPKPGEKLPPPTGTGLKLESIAYTWGGCWKDDRFPSSLASLEGKSKFLDGNFKNRKNQLQKCANAAKEHNSDLFGIKFGGKCLYSQARGKASYKANGPSSECEKGMGSVVAMDVYQLNSKDVQGEWGSWGAFGSCSKTCGGGQQTRTRQCNNPKPRGSGGKCKGKATGTGKCASISCPKNGGWGSWGAWDTRYCGSYGYKMRQRKCDNPPPKNGGTQCWGNTNFLQLDFC